mmetsp:Transcript_31875/g.95170  ORF Transcript_31875/g.95170 Transcript_31875/m.95170 type:complete len:275 (-) Transcript_31875:155-979(-)
MGRRIVRSGFPSRISERRAGSMPMYGLKVLSSLLDRSSSSRRTQVRPISSGTATILLPDSFRIRSFGSTATSGGKPPSWVLDRSKDVKLVAGASAPGRSSAAPAGVPANSSVYRSGSAVSADGGIDRRSRFIDMIRCCRLGMEPGCHGNGHCVRPALLMERVNTVWKAPNAAGGREAKWLPLRSSLPRNGAAAHRSGGSCVRRAFRSDSSLPPPLPPAAPPVPNSGRCTALPPPLKPSPAPLPGGAALLLGGAPRDGRPRRGGAPAMLTAPALW